MLKCVRKASVKNYIVRFRELICMNDSRPRVRDVGIELGDYKPGRYNAITDVEGVSVGHETLIAGEGALIPGKGPVRTGVTAVIPHGGNVFREKLRASAFVINGYGKSVGIPQLIELGTLETPILLTNTLNVGLVMDALIDYMLDRNPDIGVTTTSVNPVVCECNDSFLNDIRGRHVKKHHALKALSEAHGGIVEEGAVGAGTGMSAFEFKGGIGTSSRTLKSEGGGYTVGVLVLSNFGRREDLRIDGVPVGKELRSYGLRGGGGKGSIIIIMATDAPLNSRQLFRLAKRGAHGIARTGSYSSHSSGDFVIAFSTKNKVPHYYEKGSLEEEILLDEALDPIFKAAVEATEEAILNSLFKAETMVGRDNHVRVAIPVDEVVKIMRKYNRL